MPVGGRPSLAKILLMYFSVALWLTFSAWAIIGPYYADLRVRGLGVPGDVGERLGEREVGNGLGARRAPGGHVDPQRDRQRGRGPRSRSARVQTAVVEHGRVQAADQLAQPGDGLDGLFMRLLDRAAGCKRRARSSRSLIYKPP